MDQVSTGIDGREIVVEGETRLDDRLDIRQQLAKLAVADLQPVFGKEREAPLHGHHRVGEIALNALLRLIGDLQLTGCPTEGIQRLFQVLGLLPHLGLQGDGRLEQRIGGSADLVAALGAIDQRIDDLRLLGDLDLIRIIGIDHSGALPLGRKKATPTKVWFTCTPRCCSP